MSLTVLLTILIVVSLVLACGCVFLVLIWTCTLHARTQEIIHRVAERNAPLHGPGVAGA